MNKKYFESKERALEFQKNLNFMDKHDYWSINKFHPETFMWEIIFDIIPQYENGEIVQVNPYLTENIDLDIKGKIINKKYQRMDYNNKRFGLTIKFEDGQIIELDDSQVLYYIEPVKKPKKIEPISVKEIVREINPKTEKKIKEKSNEISGSNIFRK